MVEELMEGFERRRLSIAFSRPANIVLDTPFDSNEYLGVVLIVCKDNNS